MTLFEIIDQLTSLAEDLGEDTEVIVAYQPNWPMEVQITDIVALDPMADFDEEFGPEPTINREDINAWRAARDKAEAEGQTVVIGTAWSNEYLRTGGSAALGWR